MGGALDLTSDVAAAGSALAGLLLVFMGSLATGFDSYQKTEQRAVRTKFLWRIWFAFAGFALAILAAFFALLAKWLQIECMALVSIVLLFISFVGVVAAATRAALDVN